MQDNWTNNSRECFTLRSDSLNTYPIQHGLVFYIGPERYHVPLQPKAAQLAYLSIGLLAASSLLLPSSPHHSGRKSSTRISGLSLNILRFLHGPCQSFCASILSPTLFSSLVQSPDTPHYSYRDSASTSRNTPHRNHVQALIPNERSRGEGCEVEEAV